MAAEAPWGHSPVVQPAPLAVEPVGLAPATARSTAIQALAESPPRVPPPPARATPTATRAQAHPGAVLPPPARATPTATRARAHPGAAGAAAGAGYANNQLRHPNGAAGTADTATAAWTATTTGWGAAATARLRRGRGLGNRLADVRLGLFGL